MIPAKNIDLNPFRNGFFWVFTYALLVPIGKTEFSLWGKNYVVFLRLPYRIPTTSPLLFIIGGIVLQFKDFVKQNLCK